MSVDWGAWAGAGMAARAGLARMERLGVGAITPSAGLAALGRLLTCCHTGEPCSQAIACVLRWDRCAHIAGQLQAAKQSKFRKQLLLVGFCAAQG